jgi:hypothetical protein
VQKNFFLKFSIIVFTKKCFFSLFDDFVKKVKNSYFFTIFRIFLDINTLKLYKNNRNLVNSTRAFEWCINYHVWMKTFFFGKIEKFTFFENFKNFCQNSLKILSFQHLARNFYCATFLGTFFFFS